MNNIKKTNNTPSNDDFDFDFEDFSDLEQENQNMNNNGKAKNKKAKTPKQPKNNNGPKKPLDKRIIIGAVAAFVVIVGAIVFINLPKNGNKQLTFAIGKEKIDGAIWVADTVDKSNINKDKVDTETVVTSVLSLKLESSIDIPVVINTKLEGDTAYRDYESKFKINYNQFIIGYDVIDGYVTDYNSTSSNKLTLPDKEEFYSQETPSELIMIDLTFEVPEDFPTNDLEHKYVGLNPTLDIKIKGTEQEDKITTDMYVFSLPEFKNMNDDMTELHVGDKYSLRYIAVMPKGVTAEQYEINLVYKEKDNEYTIKLDVVDMPVVDNTDAEPDTVSIEE